MARVKGIARPPSTPTPLWVAASEVLEHAPDANEDCQQEAGVSGALAVVPADPSAVALVEESGEADGEGKSDDSRVPEECPIMESAYHHYKKNIKKYREYCAFGEGYRLGFPKLSTVITYLCPRSVPVYEAVIDLGLRFPLHPFIIQVLEGYEIDI